MSSETNAKKTAVEYVKSVLEEAAEIEAVKLAVDEPLESYGINSTMIITLNAVLEKRFESLPRTLFFQYKTIDELADYFVEHHRQAFDTDDVQASPSSGGEVREVPVLAVNDNVELSTEGDGDWFELAVPPELESRSGPLDIAIVGVAGQYPGARTLSEFWQLLVDGVDCVTEVPESRWDHSKIFSDNPEAPDKVYAKWGGFIEDHDHFDYRFFNISPREAAGLDPQERLFLQTAWHLFEDAGYPKHKMSGKKVGVYVGAMWSQYQLHAAERCSEGHLEAASSSFSSIANRVSYFFDLHGPSMAVDTMCSSSITALQLACQSIRSGESEMAVAGGVNVCSHPAKYIHLCKGKFAATDGRCRAFGADGTGYVPGEGVGAVLLKSLKSAQRDNDNIYGVIKAVALNHGGKTNGYTVPNPSAQTAVLKEAIKSSGIRAGDVSAIEAHGTGTALGDPIEISGLLAAYGEELTRDNPCAIASVKSNIGHLESAAGIAGLTKLLLQMRHRTLVPSLHVDKLNENINWDAIPFKVQREKAAWGQRRSGPLYAGLSAFGAGGSNGHVILSSFDTEKRSHIHAPQLLVISASTKQSLASLCEAHADFIEADKPNLVDVAYTLQVGREPFKHRVSLIATDRDDAVKQLRQAVSSLRLDQKCDVYSYAPSALIPRSFMEAAGQEVVEKLFQKNDWQALSEIYLCGLDLDWWALYENVQAADKGCRISLPGYVFDAKPVGYQQPKWLEGTPTDASDDGAQIPPALSNLDNVQLPSDEAPAEKMMFLGRESWEPIKTLSSENEEVPLSGFILADSESAGLAKQLQSLESFHKFQILNTAESSWAQAIGSLDARHSDAFGVVSLFDERTAASDVSAADESVLSRILALGRLFKSRCRLRLLQVRVISSSEPSVRPSLADGFARALSGEFSRLDAASLRWSMAPEISVLGENELRAFQSLWRTFSPARIYRRIEQETQTCAWRSVAPNPSQVSLYLDKYQIITGGTGGIGLEIAKWLVARGAEHIILCGREAIPHRREWTALINSVDTPARLRYKLTQLLSLPESVKTTVLNLEDEKDVSVFLSDLSRDRGVDSVFHCAGLADQSAPLFVQKTRESIEKVLAPKVVGAQNLLAGLRETDCQRLVFISSLASRCPGLAAGLVDYATANEYLNALAASAESLEDSPEVVSVLMPNWREVGLGETTSDHYKNLGLTAVDNAEGIALLEHAISARTSVVAPVYASHAFDFERLSSVEDYRSKNSPRPASGGISKQDGADRVQRNAKAVSKGQKPGVGHDLVVEELKRRLAPELGMSTTEWRDEEEFANLGVDSVLLSSFAAQIEKWLGIPFSADVLLAHTSLPKLAGHLLDEHRAHLGDAISQSAGDTEATPAVPSASEEKAASASSSVTERETVVDVVNPNKPVRQYERATHANGSVDEPIAIVGMGAIFPKADDIGAYWDNLINGRSAIQEVPSSRWDIANVFDPSGKQGSSISKWGGFVEGAEYFRPSDFGLPDEIGADADPLLRLALRASAAALRDAGLSPQDVDGLNGGVFIGSRVSTYANRSSAYGRSTLLGLAQNFIASHISHWLNLKGPALVLDSACSSSLLSLHMACQSLRNQDCDFALAGGSEFLLDETPYQMLSQAKALSPSGQCRTFDANADGFVPGEGAGIVVLKTLSQALMDGDRIYALVSGSAVNNDGRTMGVTTPNPEAQKEVIKKALSKSGFSAKDIGYVEAHGTGTPLGDPMELKALTEVYRADAQENGYCAIGSVKSNMGHLLSAAGAASVIKVALSIYHKTLVPTLNCSTPNPRFNFETSPFYTSREARPWHSSDGRCRAGISAFGFGGTNVHVVMSDMHLDRAYKPIREPLPTAEEDDKPYLWHDRKKPLQVEEVDTTAPAHAHSQSDTATRNSSVSTAFNWKKTG